MIPILYETNEKSFASNGIGRLTDCVSCVVTEERNGRYEVEMTYPITGEHFADIINDRIILCTHDETGDRQPFVIYGHEAPINGLVTFYAHHITYRLSAVVVRPFYASSVAQAFALFRSSAMTTNDFEFWTDNGTAGTMNVKTPVTVRSILGGVSGSVLDVFGGEYEWDKFTVKNHAARGSNAGVTIRYGKNLVDLTHRVDRMLPYNAVVPYWADAEGNCVYGSIVYGAAGISESSYWTDENGAMLTDENSARLEFGYATDNVSVLDLSSKYANTTPTAAQLEADAAAWLASNKPWLPSENLVIDFVALWQTDEYKDIASLERVKLCDTVKVIYAELGVEATAKVIRTAWNVLTDRYDEIELGQARSSFAETVTQPIEAQIETLPTASEMQNAIEYATEMIAGGFGGNVVINRDQDGKPYELLIMDTDDPATAVNVWRWNLNGLAHSHSGYNGPFNDFAITADGKINANMITTGLLSANRIRGGVLELGGYQNGNGVLHVLDAAGNVIGKWDNTGADITGNLTLRKSYQGQASDTLTMETKIAQVSYNGSYGTTKAQGLQIVEESDRGYRAEFDVVPNLRSSEGSLIQFISPTSTPRIKMLYATNVNTPRQSYEIRMNVTDELEFDTLRVDSNLDRHEAVLLFGDTRFLYEGGLIQGSTRYGLRVDSQGLYVNGTWYNPVSSRRYKEQIKPLTDESLNPDRLLGLKVVQFKYKDGAPLRYLDMAGQTVPGIIAEDVAEIYPAAVVHNVDGQVESWDERRIIPGMLALIQRQQKQIDDLEARMARLEARIADT